MSGHTPGPWMLRDTRAADVVAPRRLPTGGVIRETTIANCGGFQSNIDSERFLEENMANARLIAAAPDLLEAAKLALYEAEGWVHDQLDGTSSLDDALARLDSVRAAIAAAEGDTT